MTQSYSGSRNPLEMWECHCNCIIRGHRGLCACVFMVHYHLYQGCFYDKMSLWSDRSASPVGPDAHSSYLYPIDAYILRCYIFICLALLWVYMSCVVICLYVLRCYMFICLALLYVLRCYVCICLALLYVYMSRCYMFICLALLCVYVLRCYMFICLALLCVYMSRCYMCICLALLYVYVLRCYMFICLALLYVYMSCVVICFGILIHCARILSLSDAKPFIRFFYLFYSW